MTRPVFVSLIVAIGFAFPTSAAPKKGYWMSPPLSGYAHVVRNPKDNFLFPNVRTELKSSLDGVEAKVVVNTSAFPPDGCQSQYAKPRATLEIFKEGKIAGQHRFQGFAYFSGPRLTANLKAPPTVTVNSIVPKEPEYQTFDFSAKTGTYTQTRGDGPEPDNSREEPLIQATRTASFGDTTAAVKWNSTFGNLNAGGENWEIELKKSGKTLWSGPLEVPLQEQRVADHAIECFGPIVQSIDGSGKPVVIIRYGVSVKDAADQEDMRYFELTYYYEQSSKTFKLSTQPWGNEMPHLADHERDGKVEFITQNADFAQQLWRAKGSKLGNGSGGPIQIWRWSKENKLIDVTRLYPQEVKRHADASLVQFNDEPGNPDCYLLGYVADLCLLGQQKKALEELNKRGTKNTKAEHERIIEQMKSSGYL